ncbi:MAG: hypothetical protein U9R79_08620 [Armatimonadota bacterium]|nr:hypothetical protein [Armatimonadota bacterium]
MPAPPKFTIWFGEARAAAELVVDHTCLRHYHCDFAQIQDQTGEFAQNPKLIQDILYLDKPDVIVTAGRPEEPIVGVEFSAEAPSGHDCFQRIPRVAASVEHGVPFAYLFPERKWVERQSGGRWDQYNPLVFRVLLHISRFHGVPALGFLWPGDEQRGNPAQGRLLCAPGGTCLPASDEPRVAQVWQFVDLAVQHYVDNEPFSKMVLTEFYAQHEARMWGWYHERGGDTREWSPLTSCDTISGLNDLRGWVREVAGTWIPRVPDHLHHRDESLIYHAGTTTFRSDPYAGSLIALDYLRCRNGPTRQHRFRNLVLHLPNVSIEEIVGKAQRFYERDCPLHGDAEDANLNRLYSLHLREGCRYTKQKEIRTFCAFADMIVFNDGVVV